MKLVTLIQEIRQMVGSMPRGESLPGQRELCTRFNVSTFTLHKALRQLEQEGLVKVLARKGIFTTEPARAQTRRLRLVFLDKPGVLRVSDYGLNAFMAVAGRHHVECHVTHIDGGDMDALGRILAESRETPDVAGVIVDGYFDEGTFEFLRRFNQPWVMFGDGHCLRALNDAPIVAPDQFQGNVLAAERLIAQGCDCLVLVNFRGETDWPWVRESRAAIFAIGDERPQVRIVLPETPAIASPARFEEEVRQRLTEIKPARVGILCRCFYALHAATPLSRLAEVRPDALLMVIDEDYAPETYPHVQQVICPMEKRAEAALRRLTAQRRGVDSSGRMKIPYEIIAPPGASAGA